MNSKRAKQLRRLTACGIGKTYKEVKRMYKDKTLNAYLEVESDKRAECMPTIFDSNLDTCQSKP